LVGTHIRRGRVQPFNLFIPPNTHQQLESQSYHEPSSLHVEHSTMNQSTGSLHDRYQKYGGGDEIQEYNRHFLARSVEASSIIASYRGESQHERSRGHFYVKMKVRNVCIFYAVFAQQWQEQLSTKEATGIQKEIMA
jgi:hypothetical protein